MDDEILGGGGTATETNVEYTGPAVDMDSALKDISDSLGFSAPADDADGESTKTTTTDEAKPAAPAVAKPADTTPAVTSPTDVAPKTWKPEEAAVWATIPPEAKAAIARREEEMFRGIEGYKEKAAFGLKLDSVFKPYEQLMRQHNIDPVQNTANLMQVHYTLATGSQEQRQQLFHRLATDYQIDIGALADAEASKPYVDPNVAKLERELAELRAGQSQLHNQRVEEARSKAMAEVNAFAAKPENEHFDTVANEIAMLLKANPNLDLASAYEQAVWANPTTRAKEIEKQRVSFDSKKAQEAAEKLASVKKSTAVNVNVRPKSGAATLPLGTMDDTMAETLNAIKKRS